MTLGNIVRPAVLTDQRRLADMIHTSHHVHRHLDWREPVSWIGSSPFLVIEAGDGISAALSCPQDPPGIAWIRLFTCSDSSWEHQAWPMLWDVACRELTRRPGMIAAAILLEPWLMPILEASGFQCRQQIVMLECSTPLSQPLGMDDSLTIRPMLTYDLPAVTEVDAAAFDLLWQNSLPALTSGYRHAALAAVAEMNGQVIGYHISTRNSLGIHLARLAVRPGLQGRGVGQALVQDLFAQAHRRSIHHFTVNTQNDNSTSLALYKKLGFHETGERYPVYQLQVS